MKSIGIGVVGTGDVALKLYLPELSSLSPEKARLVAVCDVDPARAERARAKFGVERVYPSYRELVGADEVDLVLNLTHHKMHAEVNLAAIESGKSVYSEKPLAITFAEADMLVKKAAERHVTLAAAPAIVLDPLVAMTKKLYDDGELGKMCFARVHGSHEGASLHGRYYDNAWYHKKTEGGGPLFDTGVYALHTVTGVLGPAKRVVAFSSLRRPERYVGFVWQEDFEPYTMEIDADDNVVLMLDWGDGSFAQVDSSHCMLASQGPWAEFYGTEGVAVSGAGEAPRNEGVPLLQIYQEDVKFGHRGWFKVYPRRGERRWSIEQGVEHVIDCMREGRKPLNSGEHARHVVEIIEKARESAEQGAILPLESTF
jgi:predicted dehydrogenase